MSKKMKLIVAVTCMVVVGCIGGTGYVVYNAQEQMDSKVSEIERLEQEFALADQRADAAEKKCDELTDEIRKMEEKLEKTTLNCQSYKKKLSNAKAELETLKSGTSAAYSTSVEIASTPEVTQAPSIAMYDECYRDHEGIFAYYGMEMILHSNGDGTYDITIQDTVPGADGVNCTSATGRWENDVLTYTNGSRSHSDGGVYETVATDCTGTIRHADGGGMIWSDSMGGTDIGPFTWKS